MNKRSYFRQFTFSALFLLLFANAAFAQNAPAPRQEKLLNGLKLLVWNNPNADKVTVKLRIHSGSAFDPQSKEGVMALLGDILFPNENLKEFFAEELGGSLMIESNYDYIQISATGDNDKVLTMLETISAAVSNPPIDKENTARVLTARLEKIKELEQNPAYIADASARRHLLGNFPYGRAQGGTSESLAKVDFADLLFARDRFLTADNATIAVAGNVKPDLIYRAVRRYFGAWRKSEQRVPATFAQPEKPDEKPFRINSQYAENMQMRYAIRGLARSDKDFYAAQILTKALQNRLQNRIPNENGKEVFVRQEGNLLPGVIIFGYTAQAESGKNENIVTLIMTGNITEQEFAKAKSEFLSGFNQNDLMENWLNVDTYKLASVKDEMQRASGITLAEVNQVLEKLRKQPVVTLSLTKKMNESAEKPKDN